MGMHVDMAAEVSCYDHSVVNNSNNISCVYVVVGLSECVYCMCGCLSCHTVGPVGMLNGSASLLADKTLGNAATATYQLALGMIASVCSFL